METAELGEENEMRCCMHICIPQGELKLTVKGFREPNSTAADKPQRNFSG